MIFLFFFLLFYYSVLIFFIFCIYVFNPSLNSDGSMHITKQSGLMETRALCEQINKQTSAEMQAVVHSTTRW